MLTGNDLLLAVQKLAEQQQLPKDYQQETEMTDFSQKRFVDLGQIIFQDLVKGYHNSLHNPNVDEGYGEVEDHKLVYKWFAEMSFSAAEEFANKVFEHQEDT